MVGCSCGARPVHLIITMIKWVRTSRLSIKKSLYGRDRDGRAVWREAIEVPDAALRKLEKAQRFGPPRQRPTPSGDGGLSKMSDTRTARQEPATQHQTSTRGVERGAGGGQTARGTRPARRFSLSRRRTGGTRRLAACWLLRGGVRRKGCLCAPHFHVRPLSLRRSLQLRSRDFLKKESPRARLKRNISGRGRLRSPCTVHRPC